MKSLNNKGQSKKFQVSYPDEMLDRIDKLDKKFVESGTTYYRAALIRHLIDLGLQCYEQGELEDQIDKLREERLKR